MQLKSETTPEMPIRVAGPGPDDVPAPRRREGRRRLAGIALLVVIGLIGLAPIAQMILQSFNVAGFGSAFVFGLDGWKDLVSSERSLGALWNTVILSLRVPLAVAIGLVIAWFLARTEFPGRGLVEYSLWFAFFLPTLPIALGWIVLADPHTGLINQWLSSLPGGLSVNIYSIPGLLWVHVTLTTVPIMSLFLAPAMRSMDTSFEEAATMSGAGTWWTLRKVTFPLIGPAILAATLVGFIRSLEIFEVEQILGTPAGIDVYATRIYDQIRWDPPLYPQAMALGVVTLLALLALALGYQMMLRRTGVHATIGGRGVRSSTYVTPRVKRIAVGGIHLLMGLGVFLPLIVVAIGSVSWRFGYVSSGRWTLDHWTTTITDATYAISLRNSLFVSSGTALIGVLVYAVLAWIIARRMVAYTDALSFVVWLPWAVPGLLLGFAWTAIILGSPLAGLVWGTLVPLIAVLAFKELPLGVQMLRTAMGQVSVELEEAALMSGAGRGMILRRIVLPLVVPMLGTVFVFTFMMAFRDIGTTVMLATPGTKTMALLLFEYAVAGSYESAAVIGVMMAVIATLVAGVASAAARRYGTTFA